jgi:hypothetical protein
LYAILIDEAASGISRDAFLGAMTAENIGIGVHYQSLPEHKFIIRKDLDGSRKTIRMRCGLESRQ